MGQRDVIAFLSDGASYGKPGIAVDRIDTHISVVFLIADRAYKLKRAVSFSYLDYSTAALREKFRKAELDLNRRTAPTIYLRVRAIGRGAHGNLLFNDGAIIDRVMETRRFSQSALFDYLANAHKLTPQLMRDLTDVIAVRFMAPLQSSLATEAARASKRWWPAMLSICFDHARLSICKAVEHNIAGEPEM